MAGTLFGLLSCLGYTAANACLRAVSDCDPAWVSCVKAWPTVLVSAAWLLWDIARRRPVVPTWRVLLMVLGAGLLGQLGGNIPFQWSLGVVGVALAAPLAQGSTIIAAALLGRFALGERLSAKTLFSVAILCAAIAALSWGARQAASTASSVGSRRLAWGVAAPCASGIAYAVLGMVIRYGARGRITVAMMLFVVSTVGALSLGSIAHARLGLERIWETEQPDLRMMLAAGVFNAIAFFALMMALRRTTLVYVNGLSASQAALSALCGTLLFSEPPSWALAIGIGLTIIGLATMDRRQ